MASSSGLQVGEVYSLVMGQATVAGFYTEDAVAKVRANICPFSPEDGRTPLSQPGTVVSMPVEKFLAQMAQYESDQALREHLAKQRAKRGKP